METIKKKKLWISGGLVGILLLAMTISDIYYSDLRENYPLLKLDELIEGKITGFKILHKYTYIELDSIKKRNIPPSFLVGPETTYFHEMIRIGDNLIHVENSDKIMVSRDNETYNYIVAGLR